MGFDPAETIPVRVAGVVKAVKQSAIPAMLWSHHVKDDGNQFFSRSWIEW